MPAQILRGKPHKGKARRLDNRQATLDIDRRCLELRKAGHSYPEIAEQVGYHNPGSAYKAVKRALDDVVTPLADDVRKIELERLDNMLRAIWPKAVAGENKAIYTALSIMERRARYLGLDAPTKQEVTGRDSGPVQVVIRSPEEMAALEAELALLERQAAKRAESAITLPPGQYRALSGPTEAQEGS